jgi:PTH1 family peptidyl-tRNA hydrolase
MDLPLGKIRLRQKGAAGGHNGMESIIGALATQDFPRLRVGIGRPPAGSDAVEYVLSTMSEDDRRSANAAVERSAQAVACVLNEGVTVAMNRFN